MLKIQWKNSKLNQHHTKKAGISTTYNGILCWYECIHCMCWMSTVFQCAASMINHNSYTYLLQGEPPVPWSICYKLVQKDVQVGFCATPAVCKCRHLPHLFTHRKRGISAVQPVVNKKRCGSYSLCHIIIIIIIINLSVVCSCAMDLQR